MKHENVIGINRNIMEFKGEQDRSCLGKYKELIET